MSSGGYSPIGSANDVQMVNPEQYGSAMSMLSGSMPGYSSGFQNAQGQSSSMLGQMGALSGNYNNLIAQLMGTGGGQGGLVGKLGQVAEQYDPNAGMNLFLSQQPALQGVAERMATNSLSQYGQSAEELARETSRASLSDTASQLAASGLLGAGAGTSAMTQAALRPQLEAQTALSQARAGMLSQIGGQLASQGLSQAQGAYDTSQNALMQGVLGQMQGVGQAGSLLGQQISGLGQGAQGYAQLGSSLASLLGNAQSSYAQMSQPEYWQPQYEKQAGLFDYVSMLAPIAGSLLGGPVGGAAGAGLSALLSGIGGKGYANSSGYSGPNSSYYGDSKTRLYGSEDWSK